MSKKNEPEKKINHSTIVAYIGVAIALLSFLFNIYNYNRTNELNVKQSNLIDVVAQTKTDDLLNKAWDILGGKEGCDVSFKFVSDKTQLELANRKIDEAIQNTPTSSKAYLLKGMYNEAISNYTEACNFYIKAIELDSNSANNYLNLGNALFRLEKYTEAENQYKKALLKDKDNYIIHNNLEILYKKLGQNDRAKKAERRVKYIMEYNHVSSTDSSIKNDSIYQDIIVRKKSQIGRSFNDNTFRTDISKRKDSRGSN